jgi:Cu/Ag efflux pump CusA
MRWMVRTSMRAHRAVIAAAVVVMAFGLWQLPKSKVDTLPEFNPPTVEVQTEALGLSAEEVEDLITVPLEQDLLDGVAFLDTIHSASVPGLSSVELVFQPGTNLYIARQVVQERISQAAGLPQVSRPPQMLQPRASTSRTAMIALSSKTLTPVQIGVLARWTIRPRLLSVPGVANVAIWGQRERQLQVQVDPQKLADKNVRLEQVISSAGNALWVSPLTFLEASTPGTGGFIDTPQQRLGIQHNLPIIKPSDLGEIAIDDAPEGSGLKLGDVATVVEDHQPLIGDAIVDGSDAGGFLVVVDRLPYANTKEVTEGVQGALDELAPGLSGLTMDSSIYDPASYVDASVDHLSRSLVVGAVLLLIGLFVLLLSWRRALTALASVAVAFTVAALVLRLLDQTFTVLVFAGLLAAVAALVDDAVAHVDAVRRRAGAAPDGLSRAALLRDVTEETGHTVVWAGVVVALAVVPIFLMHGLSGDDFFPPMAAGFLLAILASLVVAATVAPALSLVLLSGDQAHDETPLFRRVQRAYARALAPVLRRPMVLAVVGAALVVATVVAVPRFDKSLVPPLKDTNVLVQWSAPFGTALPEMDRITARAGRELRGLRGVDQVGTNVGQATLGDQAVGTDSAETWVTIDEDADYEATLASVRRVVAGYPGMGHRLVTYTQDRMRHVLERTNDEITVRVFGYDFGVLDQQAADVERLLARTKGIRNARTSARPAEPTMQVQVDIAKARAVGLKPGDVRRAAATLVSGLRVGNLFEDQKVFDVVVWSQPDKRQSVSAVQSLLIDTPTGAHVRLGDVADVSVRPTVPRIEHEDISRFVDVTADVHGRSVGAVARSVRDQLRARAFPLEFHAEVLGDYASQQHAQQRVVELAIAAAVGVFLLLQAAFRSWRLALIAFITLPIALGGGLLAAGMDDGPMTLATVAGLLAVLALAVRNAIRLMGRIHYLRTEEAVAFGPELAARAARDRLGPVLVTALTTALFLLPAVAWGEISGQELVHPLAVVVLGGLVSSALVALFLLPALYVRFGPAQEPVPLDIEIDLSRTTPARVSEPAGSGGQR